MNNGFENPPSRIEIFFFIEEGFAIEIFENLQLFLLKDFTKVNEISYRRFSNFVHFVNKATVPSVYKTILIIDDLSKFIAHFNPTFFRRLCFFKGDIILINACGREGLRRIRRIFSFTLDPRMFVSFGNNDKKNNRYHMKPFKLFHDKPAFFQTIENPLGLYDRSLQVRHFPHIGESDKDIVEAENIFDSIF